MLKQKIDKAAFDALPDVIKAEYKPSGNDYVLDSEDAREAIAARDREKQRADQLQAQIDDINKKLADAQKAKDDAEHETAKKAGDVTAIEASWQKKLDDAKADADKTIKGLQEKLKGLLVVKEAQRIATAISTVPSLMVDVIARRLSAEVDADVPFTRVLDSAGRPSALTLDDLQQEIVTNPEYATIIKATGASGGGAGGGSGGGGAGGGGTTTKKLSDMTEAERRTLYRDNRAEFDRLVNEQRAAR